MSALSLLLNVLWIIFGGPWMAVGWIIAAVVMAITIIGLPWTRAALNIALYTLLPFGQRAVSRAEYYGQRDIRHRPVRPPGQYHLVGACGLVVGVGTFDHRYTSRRNHSGYSLRVGALEACGNSALADRKDHRADRGRNAPGL